MASETVVPSYAELFPELPQASKAEAPHAVIAPVKPRTITEVFSVPVEEQRYRQLDENVFGSAAEQARVCSEISRATDTKIEMNLSKDKTLSICITGKRESVKEAKKSLLQKLQKQANFDLAIPKNIHSFLIGKEGKTVKELMDSTSTIIRIPKSDDPSNLINVSGTAENIRAAIAKIQLMSDEKAKMDFVRLPIIKAFHALIAGFQQSNIKRISEANAVRIHLPPYNIVKDEIVVSGEKAGVARAVAELNAIYEQKRATCGELPVPIEKGKHKFVRGPRGANVDEVFQSTGVHVDIPALDSDSNVVTLRGETTRLAEALAKVYEFSNSMAALTMKVPDWLHRHLVGPKGANIHKIHASHPKVHVNFGDNDLIEIEGPTADAHEVQALIKKQVAELQARLTYVDIKGNPAHYRHLIGKGGSIINKIKADTGVSIQLPENDGVSDLIRVEGSPASVATAKATIEAILKKIADSKSVDVIIEQKFHSQLIGAKGANIRDMIEQFGGISFIFPNSKEASDIVILRGDKKNVDAAEKFLKSEVKRLIESNYTIEVSLYSQFIKYIIGKAGATLNQIKAETDTRISIPKDASETTLVKITGTQKNCELARDQILKIQQEQANVITETVEIDPKFHNGIIGAKGKVVKDIMASHGGVNIVFPKDKTSNKVTVRGDRADVEKAVVTLKELANEKALNSFTLEFAAKKQFHRFIIGSKGSGLSKIKESGVRVIIPAAQDEDADTITLVGKEAACIAARDAILARIKELESIVESSVDVPSEHHRHFFFKSGQVLKELTDEFGVVINFPREGETVVVRGGVELVPQAIAKINEIIADLKAQITKVVEIPSEHHGFVVGAAGKNVQRISAEFNVNIKFPKSSKKSRDSKDKAVVKADADAETTWSPAAATTEATTEASVDASAEVTIPADHLASVDEVPVAAANSADAVIVKGKESDVDAAIAALLASVPETEEYEFPSEYFGNIIGPKGEAIRKLMTDYNVNIKVPNAESGSNALVLKGLHADIEAIKPVLAKRLTELDGDKADRELRSFKVHVPVDAKHHSSFIGKAGAVVIKLREQFGVQFDFPKNDKNGNPVGDQNIITITGYEAKVLAAQAHILDKVAAVDSLVTKELEVDPKIHARIIGAKGAGIKELQDKFKVRVNFPKNKDSAIITIVGEAANVEDAYEEIKAQAEEFGEVIAEREEYLRSKNEPVAAPAHAAASKAKEVPWANDATFFPSLAASASPLKLHGAWARK